ncbi:MAG TPA: response regulator, partial [Phycisphaerales bacterium]|nr:response regulator [Phycisphaerales bacterium]
IARLFKPFQQAEHSTETAFGGTGLGLVISKQLAEQLGGDIFVESTFGSGSTFTITIGTGEVIETEQAEEAEEDVVCHEPKEPAQPLSPCRILLAEDSDDSRKLLKHLLKRAGAEVVAVADGRAAVQAVTKASGKRFDLVILDMHMPELDGPGAAAELRTFGCTLPILALTAATGSEEQHTCLKAGFDDFAGKPITSDRLISICRRCIDAHRERRAA